ncbi:SOS response-associated peptidase (plasmid) [Lichenicola cladoniae]|uniref:Abasic site processing protein n=2 Tax=Lichenicola cladoniae TaxID=1484109 RepID=A0A6M8HZ62_9PROT|nr:SOS response-associated peptidase [Acetobacteraceae bacterium]QKE93692.1 SOS response-associated peptidase [Lichenicola cladoniae]
MTSRFVSAQPQNILQTVFATASSDLGTGPNFNVSQGQKVSVVRRNMVTGRRELQLMHWGLIPSWSKGRGKQPTAAPVERLKTSGMFRLAVALRRCIVPMDAFYEWDQTTRAQQPFAFDRQDRALLAVAGLWDLWQDPFGYEVSSFSIITTTANTLMAAVHDRMPVVLEPEDWDVWLNKGPLELLRPAREDVLCRWRVSNRVNERDNNDSRNLISATASLPFQKIH